MNLQNNIFNTFENLKRIDKAVEDFEKNKISSLSHGKITFDQL